MKKFTRHKTYDEIRAQCRMLRVPLNDEQYRVYGWDTILVGAKDLGFVIYNTFNGRFFGKTDKGVDFNSDSTRHDRTAWMQQLLAFFYVEK